ncbi:hypothetical protein GCM10010430_50620 [Kitasatospora cystarginea]|uniref:Uncharacterized protein n=1 Tax=Kitasatospora cystarginea TaxID=58350 RepID=A0ABN3EJQ7_9ACTN
MSFRPDLSFSPASARVRVLAGLYRAFAEHEKRQAYPESVAQAHADFAVASGEQGPALRRGSFTGGGRQDADVTHPAAG